MPASQAGEAGSIPVSCFIFFVCNENIEELGLEILPINWCKKDHEIIYEEVNYYGFKTGKGKS